MKIYIVWRSGCIAQTFFISAALHGAEWSASLPGRFTPGKLPRLPIGYDDGWASDPVLALWRRDKTCHAGKQSRTFQPVARHYID
jgi:hypothetical protein